jgi:hypothetical protein
MKYNRRPDYSRSVIASDSSVIASDNSVIASDSSEAQAHFT